MKVLDYLISVEEDGLSMYQTLEKETEHPELKPMFHLLIDAQQEHVDHLMALKDSMMGGNSMILTEEQTLEITNDFRKILESRDIHSEFERDPDGLAHIMKAEEECIHMLESIAHQEPEGGDRDMLERLGEEEREYLERLVSIGEFYEAPRTYLEWGEFSNLHPL